MKKAGRIMGIAMISLLLGVILFYFLLTFLIAPAVNDQTAKALYEKMLQIPLPEGAELCDSRYMAGNLVGNGNKMQYFAAVLLRTDQTEEELEAYYAPYREDEWHFLVEIQQGTAISPLEGREEFSFPEETRGEEYYIVYSWGSSDFPFQDWDLRAH